MFDRHIKPLLTVPVLLIMLLYLLAPANINADTPLQENGDTAEEIYKEDINKNGNVNIVDVVALLLRSKADPEDPVADYTDDGECNILDVAAIMQNIMEGNLSPLEKFMLTGRVVQNGQGLAELAVRVGGEGIHRGLKTDSLGVFQVADLPDGKYEVWCIKSAYNYTFNPEYSQVIINGDSIIVPDIKAILALYTLSGSVLEDSVGLANVTVRVQGIGVDTSVVTDSNGNYSLEGLLDANYSVTPQLQDYTFNPMSVTVTIWGESVVASDIEATSVGPSPPELHVISGMVYCSVQPLSNVEVILMGDREASTITDGSGNYIFVVPDGNYVISGVPNPSFQMFTPASHTVTVAGEDIVGLQFFAHGSPH
jgi:hypothetical protein